MKNINERESTSIETSKMKRKEKRGWKEKEIKSPRTVGQLQMYYIHVYLNTRSGRKQERHRSNIWSNNDGELSYINIKHKTTHRNLR